MAKQAILSRRGSSWSLCSSSSTSSLNQFRQHHSGVVKFKTELCNNFMETGKCPYGEVCKFAHGKNDIQEQLPPNMKYKSELCRDYHGKGICYFGVRCHFVHEKPNPWKSLEEFWKKLGLINDETSRKL